MNIRYLLLGGVAVLLGFLFYPRGEVVSGGDAQFIKPVRRIDDEPLRYTDILRADPIVTTYDLGFVYKIDEAVVLFEDADESGPRQFDLLVHTDRTKGRFNRAFSYTGSSREYTYPLQSFPIPLEARWVQVVINDWFSNKPQLRADEFRVGLRYQSHSPILTADANYNSVELGRLIDLIPFETSKWIGAQRIAETVEEGQNQEKAIHYESPSSAVVVTVSLEGIQKLYGVRVTTDGPGNNLKRYQILTSIDGQRYTKRYVSDILTDETVTDLHQFDSPVSGRYLRLRIERGDWYGDYPEIREFEVFTDNYRPSPPADHGLDDFNAVPMYHENLGEARNLYAPHLDQGFAFDRETHENRYLLPIGDEANTVDTGNTPGQRSFAYHYDTVKIKYNRLNPSLLYWTQVTYLQGKGGQRMQNLVVDGFILHDAMALPRGKAKSYTYAIPSEAYADSEIELNFNRLAGLNAAVSEVMLLEARPTSGTDVASTQSADQADETIGRAIRMSEKVVIDGRVDEWPLLYPMLAQNYKRAEDSPVALYAQWDDDNLYVAALISTKSRKARNNEALHLFVDATLNRSPGMYKVSDHHLIFNISDARKSQPQVRPSQIHHHRDAIPAHIDHRKEIEANVSKTEFGYALEAKIPKDFVLNRFDPGMDKSIGLNYILADAKSANHPSDWFAYATPDPHAPPNGWNPVELVGKISGQVALMDEDATHPITAFNAGDTLTLGVWDAERNTDRGQPESIEAKLRNERTGQSLTLILYEADLATLADDNPDNDPANNSSFFAAKVPTAYEETRGKGTRGQGNGGTTAYGDKEKKGQGDKGTGRQGEGTKRKQGRSESSIFLVRGQDTVSVTYIDPYYSRTQRKYPVSDVVTVNTGATGTIAIITESGEPLAQFQVGDTIYMQVQDADLRLGRNRLYPLEGEGLGDAIEAALAVPETKEIETVKLTYQPDGNRYLGSIVTAYSETPQPDDGVLQTVGMQVVGAFYLDGIQATGQTNVLVHAETRVKIGDTARLDFSFRPAEFSAKPEPSSVEGGEGLPALDNRKFFKAGDALVVRLRDTDLNQNENLQETVDVTLSGAVLND